MLQVVLFQPEIPPNTGNIARLCVGARCRLHLIEPLGFSLDEKQLRRAGLDYWEDLDLSVHKSWPDFAATVEKPARVFYITKFGETVYWNTRFQAGDYLVFGRETKGLPPEILAAASPEQKLRIPMPGPVRSLNLSNACALVLYEGLRQLSGPA